MSDYVPDGPPIQTHTIGGDGTLVDTMTVYWRTPDGGVSGSVRVPLQGDWAQAAADEINAQLAQLRQAGAV